MQAVNIVEAKAASGAKTGKKSPTGGVEFMRAFTALMQEDISGKTGGAKARVGSGIGDLSPGMGDAESGGDQQKDQSSDGSQNPSVLASFAMMLPVAVPAQPVKANSPAQADTTANTVDGTVPHGDSAGKPAANGTRSLFTAYPIANQSQPADAAAGSQHADGSENPVKDKNFTSISRSGDMSEPALTPSRQSPFQAVMQRMTANRPPNQADSGSKAVTDSVKGSSFTSAWPSGQAVPVRQQTNAAADSSVNADGSTVISPGGPSSHRSGSSAKATPDMRSTNPPAVLSARVYSSQDQSSGAPVNEFSRGSVTAASARQPKATVPPADASPNQPISPASNISTSHDAPVNTATPDFVTYPVTQVLGQPAVQVLGQAVAPVQHAASRPVSATGATGSNSVGSAVPQTGDPASAKVLPTTAGTHGKGGESAKEDDGKKQDNPDGSVFSVPVAKAAQTGGADDVKPVKFDAADIARQLTDAAKQAADSGRSQIRIHLSPEELGGINIKIVSLNGALSMQISADSRHTGEMLASNMNDLNRSMSDSGVSMNKVEIFYAGTGGFDSSGGSFAGNQQQAGSHSAPKVSWQSAEPAANAAEPEPLEEGRMSLFA